MSALSPRPPTSSRSLSPSPYFVSSPMGRPIIERVNNSSSSRAGPAYPIPPQLTADAFPSTLNSSHRPAPALPQAFHALPLIPIAAINQTQNIQSQPNSQRTGTLPPASPSSSGPASNVSPFSHTNFHSTSARAHWQASLARQGIQEQTMPGQMAGSSAYRAPHLALLGTVIPMAPGVKRCVFPYCNLPFVHGHASLADQRAKARGRRRTQSPGRGKPTTSSFNHRVLQAAHSSQRTSYDGIHERLAVASDRLHERTQREAATGREKIEEDSGPSYGEDIMRSRTPSPSPGRVSSSPLVASSTASSSSLPQTLTPVVILNSHTMGGDSASPSPAITPGTSSPPNGFLLNVTVSGAASESPTPPSDSGRASPVKSPARSGSASPTPTVNRKLSTTRRSLMEEDGGNGLLTPSRSSFSGSATPLDGQGGAGGTPKATAEKLMSLMPGLERRKTFQRQVSRIDDDKRAKLEQWKAEKEAKEAAEREAREKEAERVKRHRTLQLKQRMEVDAVNRASQEAQQLEEERQKKILSDQKAREEEERKAKARDELLKAREEKERERELMRSIEAKKKAEDERIAAELAAAKAAEVLKRLAEGEFTKVLTTDEPEPKANEKKAKAEARLAAQKAEAERAKAQKAAEREKKRQQVQQQYENSLLSTQQNKGVKERAQKRKLLVTQFNKERALEEQMRKKAKSQRESNIKRLQTSVGEEIAKRVAIERLIIKASTQEELVKLNDRLRVAGDDIEARVLDLAEAIDGDYVDEVEELVRIDKLEEERARQLEAVLTQEQTSAPVIPHGLEAVPEMTDDTKNFETRPGQLMAKKALADAVSSLASPSGADSPDGRKSFNASSPSKLTQSAISAAIVKVADDRRDADDVFSQNGDSENGDDLAKGAEAAAPVDDADDNETRADIGSLISLPGLQTVLQTFDLNSLARQLAYCIRTMNRSRSILEPQVVLTRRSRVKKLIKLYKRRIQLEQWKKDKMQQEEAARQRAADHEREVKARLDFALKKRVINSLLAKRRKRIEERKRREEEQGRPFTKEELEQMRTSNMFSLISILTGQIKKEREEREQERLIEERRQKDEAARRAREEEERVRLDQEREREAKLQERLENKKLQQKIKEEKDLEEQRSKEQRMKELADRQKEIALNLKRGTSFMKPPGAQPTLNRKPSSAIPQ